jgi:UDP-N-acetylmuramate dehydrogenase
METLLKHIPGMQEHVLLKEFTNYKLGGPADYFFVAKTKEDVTRALQAARAEHIPVFVLGGGTNLLVADEGFRGLVVHVAIDGIQMHGDTVMAGAGTNMQTLVNTAIENELAGLEWAGGLPGLFGGAIRGNAGAFGGEIKDNIVSVEALDEHLELKIFSNKECDFSYRNSAFKKRGLVILSATLQLQKGNRKVLEATANDHRQFRKDRHPLEYGNAGSVFKNVPFDSFSPEWQEKLRGHIKTDPFPVIPTAVLLSQLELKGTKIGGAEVSEKHPNFLVNKEQATAADVVKLMDLVREEVRGAYGVELEPEVQLVGF